MAKVYRQQEALDQILVDATQFVTEEIIPDVVDDMKRLAPVDTGKLRDSIQQVPGQPAIQITAPYAGFVEKGTEIMPAQPFVRPALYRRRGGA